MWELDCKEGWAPKNWCFELWCWRRLLRVPWTARRSTQFILKEISPEYSLEGLMLKLKLWPPHAKSWLIGKDPDSWRDWGQEEKGTTEDEMDGWPTQWTWVWVNSWSWWWTGRPGLLRFMGSQRVRHNWATELNWTDLFFSPLPLAPLIFSAIWKVSSDNHFTFLFLGDSLILASCSMSQTSAHSSSGTPYIKSNPLKLFVTTTVQLWGIWFRSYLNGLVVFPPFFSLSLNFAIRSSWSEPQSVSGSVFADCIELLHLQLQWI